LPSGPVRLKGKAAVITGASRGIGFAVARALATEGADIVITGRDPSTLTNAAAELRKTVQSSAKIVAMPCDVRVPKSVAGLFSVVKRRFGKIDILVNNAGTFQKAMPLEQMSFEQWRDVIDSNLTSLFLCTRAALPLLQPEATVVNTLSVAAKQTFPNYYGYTAAKAGALGFTDTLRLELAPRRIRVIALMPGATDTDIWQVMPDIPRSHMMKAESIAEAVLTAVLLPPEATISELVITPTAGAV
jgi:NAD(P)-dependent dehydrogenase (short-subunit alcohol dehydrogenase family)